jgi:hypothetical protein
MEDRSLQTTYWEHCKDKIPKFRNKYFQKRNIGVSVPFSTIMRLWVIYIFPPSVCLFCWRKPVDRSWDYINRSQIHECGNWGWGRAIPRKGIHKWDFRCSVEGADVNDSKLQDGLLHLSLLHAVAAVGLCGEMRPLDRGKSGHRLFFPCPPQSSSILGILRLGLINIRVVRARESGMCASAYVWVVWECTCVGCQSVMQMYAWKRQLDENLN